MVAATRLGLGQLTIVGARRGEPDRRGGSRLDHPPIAGHHLRGLERATRRLATPAFAEQAAEPDERGRCGRECTAAHECAGQLTQRAFRRRMTAFP